MNKNSSNSNNSGSKNNGGNNGQSSSGYERRSINEGAVLIKPSTTPKPPRR